jgi:hypothetical protein
MEDMVLAAMLLRNGWIAGPNVRGGPEYIGLGTWIVVPACSYLTEFQNVWYRLLLLSVEAVDPASGDCYSRGGRVALSTAFTGSAWRTRRSSSSQDQ